MHESLTHKQIERLAMLSEEGSEIVQAVTKIIRHGYDNYNPDLPIEHRISNRTHLEEEIADIIAVIELLVEDDEILFPDSEKIAKAKEKKLKYMRYK